MEKEEIIKLALDHKTYFNGLIEINKELKKIQLLVKMNKDVVSKSAKDLAKCLKDETLPIYFKKDEVIYCISRMEGHEDHIEVKEVTNWWIN